MEEQVAAYNFLDEYQANIAPRIAEIDIFLKTEEEPFNTHEAAKVLDISEQALAQIMKEKGFDEINRAAFMEIMLAADSKICGMYQREVELNSPCTYNARQIAYIYDLDRLAVEDACNRLKIKEITGMTMPLLFACIQI